MSPGAAAEGAGRDLGMGHGDAAGGRAVARAVGEGIHHAHGNLLHRHAGKGAGAGALGQLGQQVLVRQGVLGEQGEHRLAGAAGAEAEAGGVWQANADADDALVGGPFGTCRRQAGDAEQRGLHRIAQGEQVIGDAGFGEDGLQFGLLAECLQAGAAGVWVLQAGGAGCGRAAGGAGSAPIACAGIVDAGTGASLVAHDDSPLPHRAAWERSACWWTASSAIQIIKIKKT